VNGIIVAGFGAVSPAGWGAEALQKALENGQPLPVQSVERPGWQQPLRARLVPNPLPRPALLAHPRLRRTSPVSHYAAAAAIEATGWLASGPEAQLRLGIVVCLQTGCVQFTCRFLDELIQNPSTASPLLFPETVYAAPASHVAALLNGVTLVYSLVGDPATFLQGVALGAQWLLDNRVDACLVIGAEEMNWVVADALRHFDRSAILTCGAGALCLCRQTQLDRLGASAPPRESARLTAITDLYAYSARCDRHRAARLMRQQLGEGASDELLCDGLGGSPRGDAAERAAWSNWKGARLSPKRILGEGLMAAAAWQCVAACRAISTGRVRAADVSLVGLNQQAVGARFAHANP